MSAAPLPPIGDWKHRPEGGGRFALWVIRAIACHGGRAVSRACLVPITAYFLLVRGPERRASLAYLARVLPHPPTLWDAAKHVHTFAATILDRVFLLSGRIDRFHVGLSGLDQLHAQLDRGKGLLLFGSHLGSFEVLRVVAQQRPQYKIRVVLDRMHNPALTVLLDALNPDIAANVIDAGQDGPSIAMAIKQACDDGALVAMLVDRARLGDPSLAAPFLGRPAPFPTAPWLIASVLKVPVVLAFGLYEGGRNYQLTFEPFSEGLDVPRRERAAALSALIHRYAARLEHQARRAPYNWFNFYDFWNSRPADAEPSQSNVRALGDYASGDLADAAVQRRTALRRSA